jgi:ribonuclease J
MWDGYKEKKEFKQFLSKIEEIGIDIIDLHTSGHADINTIKLVEEITKPNIIIPIHTINKLKIKELFANGITLDDNDEMEV